MRLIDADKLLDILDVMIVGHKSAGDVYDAVDSMPTVEAIPVEWIKQYCAKQAANDKIDCYWGFFEDDVLEMIKLWEQWRKENEKSGASD